MRATGASRISSAGLRAFHFGIALVLAACWAVALPSTVTATSTAGAGVAAHVEAQPRIHPLVATALACEPRVQVMLQLDRDAVLGAAGGRRPRRRVVRRAIDALLADLTEPAGLAGGSFQVVGRFDGLRAVAAWVDAGGALAAAAHSLVRRVLPDSGGTAALLQSLPLTHLSETRAAGFTGQGLAVAVIDSGIDKTHPSFAGAVVAESCFCSSNCCPNGKATQFGSGAATDQNGHGTNVAGIMAGRGLGAPMGALPDVGIIAVRVLDAQGFFSTTGDIASALSWLHQNYPAVAAVNMSLETFARFSASCDSSFLDLAGKAALLRGDGASLVAATGNEADVSQVAAPACVGDVTGVAAVWDAAQQGVTYCDDGQVVADEITCFSNRGALADLLAPGAAVTATGLGGGSSTYYGTSQASPMVAACAAALRQANSAATVAQRLHSMKQSPTTIFDAASARGYPRLDCARAVQVVTSSCGDADGDHLVKASDALAVLREAVGGMGLCPIERCDFDGSGRVQASDALATLRRAVGQSTSSACTGGI
ncbi:MAG: S8 family serine peptidase [Deltaproteobacteria bacterium]|nr:S8 family serine peptidase [Deltaproteobacteria bacterium]